MILKNGPKIAHNVQDNVRKFTYLYELVSLDLLKVHSNRCKYYVSSKTGHIRSTTSLETSNWRTLLKVLVKLQMLLKTEVKLQISVFQGTITIQF